MKLWWCEKGYSGGREEGGRGREGGEKEQIPPAVDFPQVIITSFTHAHNLYVLVVLVTNLVSF